MYALAYVRLCVVCVCRVRMCFTQENKKKNIKKQKIERNKIKVQRKIGVTESDKPSRGHEGGKNQIAK